jgi:hypothetical protein
VRLGRHSAAGLLALALAGLAFLVIQDARVNAALETTPAEALARDPSDPRALAAAADLALARARTPDQIQSAADLARRALARGPTQMDALRDLGLSRASRGDFAGAFRILSLAGARTPLDAPTHLWLMDDRLLSGDYAGAFLDADELLRHQPDRLAALAPILTAYAGPGAQALVARLATAPPWADAFLEALARRAPDPATTFAVLLGLEDRGRPPSDAAVSAYLDRRVAAGAYRAAYLDWLQLLPRAALAHAGAVYDGEFEGLPGDAPFNWAFQSGVGGEADISRSDLAPWAGALHVRYDGYSTPDLAAQLLVLDPGEWRMSGEVRSTGDAGNALAWTVVCADDPRLILASRVAPSASDGWQSFDVVFRTPARGCEGQWLRLTPIPSDHERPIEAWFTNLALARG